MLDSPGKGHRAIFLEPILRPMKNLIRIFILVLFWPSSHLFSQQLSPSVISSSGGFYTNSVATLSFTTGELAAIETYANSTSVLTQGFQQPWELGTYITEHPFKDFSFGIYPNPSDGQFYLLTESELDLRMTLTISDLIGKQLAPIQFEQGSKINIQPVDVSELPAGTYILSLSVKERNTSTENIFNHKITIVK
jgi:hypothetical protein